MFIHIGNDNMIRSRDIVTIINYETIKSSTVTDKMMTQMGPIEQIKGNEDDAKSIIVTVDDVYYCTLSVTTLKKRSNYRGTLHKFKNYFEGIEKKV